MKRERAVVKRVFALEIHGGRRRGVYDDLSGWRDLRFEIFDRPQVGAWANI